MKPGKVGIIQEIGEDLRSEKLLPGLSAGLVVSLMIIVIEVSFASIIFTSSLESHVSRGIGMLIAGSLVFVLVTTFMSGIRSVIAIPQDAPVALYAGVAAAISAAIGHPESVETFITIVAGLFISGILTGVCFYLIGRFKLAELFRFIPYPVVSGFLAGTGWLLTKGSLEVMTGINLTPATAAAYLSGSSLLLWLPGAVYALTLFFLLRRFSHFLILPGSLLLAIALYYTALWAAGLTIPGARELGMLYHPFAESALWPTFRVVDFQLVNWPVIIRQLPSIAVIPFITLLGLLLNTGGIELAIRREIDMNRELKINGLANALAGMCGAHPGYSAISLSVLGMRLGAYTRLVGLTVVLVLIITLVYGSSLLVLFPKAILGGFLLLLGLFFISDWLIDTAKKMPRVDHLMVLAIFLVIGIFGYMHGVIFGLLVTMLLFVVRFSRVPLLRGVSTNALRRSMKARSLPQQRLLLIYGTRTAIYDLEGYIFFGSVTTLINEISAAVKMPGAEKILTIILNFSQVSGFDISSVNNFVRLLNRFSDSEISFAFAAVPEGFGEMLTQNLDKKEAQMLRFFSEMEEALQWAEEKLLQEEKEILNSATAAGISARDNLFDSVSDDLLKNLERQAQVEQLLEEIESFLEVKDFARGELVLAAGDEAPGLYLVKSGVVKETLSLQGRESTAIRDLGSGTFFAEAGAFGSWRSPYNYIAQTNTQLGILTAEALLDLENELPRQAIELHRLVIGASL